MTPAADLALLDSIQRRVLWLATWMIHHANVLRPNPDGTKVGGHQASSASLTSVLTALYFHALRPGDVVAVKPHAAPAFYAIQYLLGRLPAEALGTLRAFGGLQAYPSRRKNPEIVDLSTGSMGLGAVAASFGALATRYLDDHFGVRHPARFIALVGDAELDEGNVWEALLEEAMATLGNLLWIVDLNRQSLDRVAPDGRRHQLAQMFAANGWHVIRLRWGGRLRALFESPGGSRLRQRLEVMSGAEYHALLRCPPAAARKLLVTSPEGTAPNLRCPYHGWTYSLEGALKGTPDFTGVCDFDRSASGLVQRQTTMWEQWVFVRVEPEGGSLERFLGPELRSQMERLSLGDLHWLERRHYTVNCNWKVFVDNYLDGGYHVPHLHKGLDSVLDYSGYTIRNGDRFCVQESPMVSGGADAKTGAVRTGDRAYYYWIYPNFMINWYRGAMDTNLVIPRGVDKTEVIFDFYFYDVSDSARPRNLASIDVSQQIQDEDVAICASVQRGLRSRAYNAGRLSVRREAGEHLFHRLLHADLKAGLM